MRILAALLLSLPAAAGAAPPEVPGPPRARALVWFAQLPPAHRATAQSLTEALNEASAATTALNWRWVAAGGFVDRALHRCPIPTLLQCLGATLRDPRVGAESGLMLVLRLRSRDETQVLSGVVVAAADIEAAQRRAGLSAATPDLEDRIFADASRLAPIPLPADLRSISRRLLNDLLAPHLRSVGAWRPNGTLEVAFGGCAGCVVEVDGRSGRSLVDGERLRFTRVQAGPQGVTVRQGGRPRGRCVVTVRRGRTSRLALDDCVTAVPERSRALTWIGGAAAVAGASLLIASAVLAADSPRAVCFAPTPSDCDDAVAVGGQQVNAPTFRRAEADATLPLNAVGAGLLASGVTWTVGNEWIAPESPWWVAAAGLLAGGAGAAAGAIIR